MSASLPEAMDIETTQQIEEDLSITLLERRKRLHVLATEINNWEDQETKKYERKRIQIFQFHDLKNVCYFFTAQITWKQYQHHHRIQTCPPHRFSRLTARCQQTTTAFTHQKASR